MVKPKIFVGSSVEGLDIAYAIQQNLTYDAEVTVWPQGVFELSSQTLTDLLNQRNKVDFAVFVFTPDDVLKMRNVEVKAIRDNIIFETGLFIGKLGIERVYFVMPDGQKAHLPTDLLGITGGTYENRSDNNLVAATGVFCNQVKQRLRSLGNFDHYVPYLSTEDDFETSKLIITNFLTENNYTKVSFERLHTMNARFSQPYIEKLINKFPEDFRISFIKDGKPGIALVTSSLAVLDILDAQTLNGSYKKLGNPEVQVLNNDIEEVLKINGKFNVDALDWEIKISAQKAKQLEVVFNNNGIFTFYLRVIILKQDENKTIVRWIRFDQYLVTAEKFQNNPFEMGTSYDCIPFKGFNKATININEAVQQTYGQGGWVYGKASLFRIRCDDATVKSVSFRL